jgi:hypothetical protein
VSGERGWGGVSREREERRERPLSARARAGSHFCSFFPQFCSLEEGERQRRTKKREKATLRL